MRLTKRQLMLDFGVGIKTVERWLSQARKSGIPIAFNKWDRFTLKREVPEHQVMDTLEGFLDYLIHNVLIKQGITDNEIASEWKHCGRLLLRSNSLVIDQLLKWLDANKSVTDAIQAALEELVR